MSLDHRAELLSSLDDEEYRQEFTAEHVGVGLAYQMRQIRESRGWTQADLAQRTGKAQGTISQLEDPDYGRFTLGTLKKLAKAFDVGLLVRFVRFGDLADWTIGLTPERLAPISYDEEVRQQQFFDSSMVSAEVQLSSYGTDDTFPPTGEILAEYSITASPAGHAGSGFRLGQYALTQAEFHGHAKTGTKKEAGVAA